MEVLKMEPFHFDHWMLSIVRWEPRVEASYPSEITFWVRVLGVPLHFWAEVTFRTIGGAIGRVKEVDSDAGRVRVAVNGFQPLCFETSVEFHSGEEILITLRYERLFGFCRRCFSLCHEDVDCGTPSEGEKGRQGEAGNGDRGQRVLSYKGAVSSGGDKPSDDGLEGRYGHRHGKRPVADSSQEDAGYRRGFRETRSNKHRQGGRHDEDGYKGNRTRDMGEGSERRREATFSGLMNEQRKMKAVEEEPLSGNDMKMGVEVNHSSQVCPQVVETWNLATGKPVRKSLFPVVEDSLVGSKKNDVECSKEQGDNEKGTIDGDMVMGYETTRMEDEVPAGNEIEVETLGIGEEMEMGEFKEGNEVLEGLQMHKEEEERDQRLNEQLMGPVDSIMGLGEDEAPLANGLLVSTAIDITNARDFAKQLEETVEHSRKVSPKPQRKKLVKGNLVINGLSTKKRLIQGLVSPRKKNGGKKETSIGDLLGTGKSRKAPDPLGGIKPPLPSTD